MKEIYLDNNATTRVDPVVLEEMLPFFCERYGNASSTYSFGGLVAKDIKKARERVAQLLNAEPDEILFTSCGTESDNAVIMSTMYASPDKRHAITTNVEHPAVLNTMQSLAKKGFDITFLEVNEQGAISLDALKRAIRPDTALVSIMHANNETGVIFPIEEIAQICAEKGVPFHTDAVQSVGKLPIDVKKTPLNYLSLSGHKLHAPKGVGVLYLRKGTPFTPFLLGGHQEHGRRAGTENSASIVGLGKACELSYQHFAEEVPHLTALRNKLEQGIMDIIPDLRINGGQSPRLPNTTNISFKNIEGESILLMLDELGICASSGSACTSGSLDPSHVLMAMKVPFTFAHGSVRFSLSRFTTAKEIDTVLQQLPPIILRLREMSPFRGM